KCWVTSTDSYMVEVGLAIFCCSQFVQLVIYFFRCHHLSLFFTIPGKCCVTPNTRIVASISPNEHRFTADNHPLPLDRGSEDFHYRHSFRPSAQSYDFLDCHIAPPYSNSQVPV